MIISIKYQLAFLCMPKCASTSIEAVLQKHASVVFKGSPKLKHINVRGYNSLKPIIYSLQPSLKVESFCLMREPIQWLESWYRYRGRKELAEPNHKNHKNYTGRITFNEFVTEYLKDENRKPYACFGTQFDFIRDVHGNMGVDRLYSMDNIPALVDFLSERMQSKVEISLRNVSPKIESTLNDNLRKSLYDKFHDDYLIFNKLCSKDFLTKSDSKI